MFSDCRDIFERYSRLQDGTSRLFEKISQEHEECVACKLGCSDCCHAMFDLSLVEAVALNQSFAQLPETKRQQVLIQADKADREAFRIKKELFKKSEAGAAVEDLLQEAGKVRIRCPLLDEDDTCVLYEYRPLTCRLYGIPMQIGETSRTCGLSRFKPGERYPSVNMDRLHEQLLDLSRELALRVRAGYADLPAVLVPVSMALLTKYDDEYFGIRSTAQENTGSDSQEGK
jgi:Fe-S-cluster containining protein